LRLDFFFRKIASVVHPEAPELSYFSGGTAEALRSADQKNEISVDNVSLGRTIATWASTICSELLAGGGGIFCSGAHRLFFHLFHLLMIYNEFFISFLAVFDC